MTPALMEENQPEGNTESVPRSEFLSENQCSDGNNNMADSSDITHENSTTSESNGDQTERMGHRPVCLPPRPPAPSAEAVQRNSIYGDSNPAVKQSEASEINTTMTLTASSSVESFSSIYKDLEEMRAALTEEIQPEVKAQSVFHLSDGNNNMADSSAITVDAKNSRSSKTNEDQTEQRGLRPVCPPPRPPAPRAEAVKRNNIYRRSNPVAKSSKSNEDQTKQRGLLPVRPPPRPPAPSAEAVKRNSVYGRSNSYPFVKLSVASGTNRTMTLNSNHSQESFTSIYKDLDEMKAASTEETQPEVKAQSAPRSSDGNNNMADSSDRTDKTKDSTTFESNEDQTEQRGLHPVRPPPRPPAPSAKAVERNSICVRSNPALKVAVMEETHPEHKPQSVPHQSDGNNNMADFLEITVTTKNVTTSESDEALTEHPVRPPLRPPAPTAEAFKRNSIYGRSNPPGKPSALTSGKLSSHRRSRPDRPVPPQRPPLPPIYCDRLRQERATDPDNYAYSSQQNRSSSTSSMEQAPDHSPIYEEASDFTEAYNANDMTSPVLQQPDLFDSPSGCETSPPQIRPPTPPPFNPSLLLPSEGSESVYSEVESPTYVEILPDESEEMQITGLLRWLRKTSKKDSMTPSLYGLSIDEEMRSFNQRAVNVTKALRLYNHLMIKRKDNLKNIISQFRSICGTLDKIQKKNKTMSIAGGTTGAVGGMTAVMGIALAPATIGASLVATLVGAGMVASAGAMGAHAAKANKKIVDRLTVDKLLYDYKANIVDLELCLHFILVGMNELRRHDIARLNRAGAEPDAVMMAHRSEAVHRYNTKNYRETSTPNTSEKLLLAFAKEMDQYFSEKDVTLRKSTKSKFSGRIFMLAENLQDEVNYLNDMWGIFSS